MAVLLDADTGRQIPASAAATIADIVVEKGGRPISLKLYREGSLKVGGSYKQLVDDLTGQYPTMEYVVVTKDLKGSGTIDAAEKVGKDIAAKAKKIGFEKVVFDRGGYLYHGRVRSLAEGARSSGLKF